jgi:hypothetical protein
MTPTKPPHAERWLAPDPRHGMWPDCLLWVISGCAGPSAARQVKLKKRTPELDRADLKLRNLLGG